MLVVGVRLDVLLVSFWVNQMEQHTGTFFGFQRLHINLQKVLSSVSDELLVPRCDEDGPLERRKVCWNVPRDVCPFLHIVKDEQPPLVQAHKVLANLDSNTARVSDAACEASKFKDVGHAVVGFSAAPHSLCVHPENVIVVIHCVSILDCHGGLPYTPRTFQDANPTR